MSAVSHTHTHTHTHTHIPQSYKVVIINPNTLMVILSYPDHLHSGYSDAGGIEFAEEGLLYGNLQLLVPETEDDRTEEGSKDCVGDDHQSIAFLRVETLGLEVDDRCKAIVHNDHNKMRRTGGEGFVPALG